MVGLPFARKVQSSDLGQLAGLVMREQQRLDSRSQLVIARALRIDDLELARRGLWLRPLRERRPARDWDQSAWTPLERINSPCDVHKAICRRNRKNLPHFSV